MATTIAAVLRRPSAPRQGRHSHRRIPRHWEHHRRPPGLSRRSRRHQLRLQFRPCRNPSRNSSPSLSSLSAPRAVAVRSDVFDPAQVKHLFDAAEDSFGQPQILVTSAGMMDPNYFSIADTHVEEFDRTFAVNTRGTFACLQEAAKRLRRGGGGRIITVSSSLAVMFRPGNGAYTASKAAVETLTKILAKELKGTGITVNCVAPGPVATELFFSVKTEEDVKRSVDLVPLGRLGETKDIAPVIGFLATDSGEWVNGQIVRVNWGSV